MNDNYSVGVIVTGGDFQGLGVLRSLAVMDVPTILIDHEYCIGRASRYCKRFIKSPNPADTKSYVDFLIQLSKNEKLKEWIIIPNSDKIVFNISKYESELRKYYRLPLPHNDTIEILYNKHNTYSLCENIGIPIPRTYLSENLDQLLAKNLSYPLVIKPAVRDNYYTYVKTKAYKINSQDELIKIYEKVNEIIPQSEIIVQEMIIGGPKNLYSFCCFFKNGKVINGITARRTRQHPMDFGHATTFAELVDIPQLKEYATKLLDNINYYGICETEFMYDEVEEKYKLIEVNPRVWGWHSLAIASGINLPFMLYLDMINQPVPEVLPKTNLKWIRITTDFVTVIKEILSGRLSISNYFRSIKGEKEFAVFSINDPLPFFTEILIFPYLWKKRGF
jgi:D-aspartate ligase